MGLTIVEQLNKIYDKYEWWQSHKETLAGITNYHQAMLDKGNLICYIIEGEVLGYVEVWRINYEQFGRLICHEKFVAPFEDTIHGNIAYVSNVWIREDKRKSEVTEFLKKEFFKRNHHCDYFVGEALRKTSSQPIKVFKKSELSGKLFKEGLKKE